MRQTETETVRERGGGGGEGKGRGRERMRFCKKTKQITLNNHFLGSWVKDNVFL